MQQDPTEKIYSLKNSFTIIGLTGRTGAGVSSVSDILSNDFSKIESIQPLKKEPLNNKKRRYNISHNFASVNWKKYTTISYKNIILIHILRSSNDDFYKFLEQNQFNNNEIEKFKELYKKHQHIIDKLNSFTNINNKLKNKKKLKKLAKIFFHKDFESLSSEFNKLLKENSFIKRIELFSEIANNVRKSGKCFGNNDENGIHIYSLAETINRIIKGAKKEDTHIVIDSLRNSLEIMFFKERYSAFYMLSINSIHRRNFLKEKYTDSNIIDKILKIDDKEYEGKGFSEGKFYLQDVQNCIQKSDIHFNNNPPLEDYKKDLSDSKIRERSNYYLVGQIIRYTGLILHPGLITPSAQERCMQMAYVAKSNSGCISRQVGAVITDQNFSMKSTGWNDVPNNVTPCILKNVVDLKNGKDKEAYSPFEKETKYGFNEKFKNYYSDIENETTKGMNCSFCFKDIYNLVKQKENQVHTRSLHAEENAMLQISKYGGQALKNGILFTTASPCELCAKKARQLEINKIYYIDPYPGISEWHILRDGNSIPELFLFSGAVGEAYHKLYEPIMSYKDELALKIKKRPKNDLKNGFILS
jgi:dCMP deaminase